VSNAEDDLFEIYRFVYFNDSKDKAENLYSKIYERCYTLQDHALRGQKVPELVNLGINEFYQIHFKPYRIIYKISDDDVLIYCILDGRRSLQEILQDRLIGE